MTSTETAARALCVVPAVYGGGETRSELFDPEPESEPEPDECDGDDEEVPVGGGCAHSAKN